MKKLIYISGVASANFMLLGSIFKIMHWPGANIMLVLAVFIFCLWFLPSALLSSYKSQEEKKYKWLYIVTFIVFFIVIAGALFKIMHWPGAGWFLIAGVLLPFVLFLPVYLFQTRKDTKNVSLNFMGIMFGLTFLAVFSVLLSLNIGRSILEDITMNAFCNERFTSYLEHKKGNIENEVTKKSDELYNYIEKIKDELLEATGNRENKEMQNKNPKFIYNADNTEFPYLILFKKDGVGELSHLISKIRAFRDGLLSSEKLTEEQRELVNSLFSVDDQSGNPAGTWEQREIQGNYCLANVLEVLTRMQSNVRFVESELVAEY